MDKVTGYVTGVNGNLVAATFSGSVRKNEVGYVQVGDDRLKGEVIRVNGDTASMQIYEMTNGIQVGDRVELGGLLGSAPVMPVHPESSADFIARGGRIPAPLHSLRN